ncbi:hypothetical protein OIU76_024331 [Salix suchowensis]|nr:hypothetical protein OIU76_024331 [Salix suchowensis]
MAVAFYFSGVVTIASLCSEKVRDRVSPLSFESWCLPQVNEDFATFREVAVCPQGQRMFILAGKSEFVVYRPAAEPMFFRPMGTGQCFGQNSRDTNFRDIT